jgi:predicted O-linked N-acetylglucosamine transferase (SPINDLY family)
LIKPDFDFCRRDLCVCLAQAGRIEEARSLMREGPAFDENSASYYFFIGNMQLVSGENLEACVSFSKALQLQPGDAQILLNLGASQLRLQNPHGALKTYQSLLQIDDNSAQTYAHIAAALQQMGHLQSAIETYYKALQIDPDYLAARQSLLFALTYTVNYRQDEYLKEAKVYGALVSAKAMPYSHWACLEDSCIERPIRVGFLSGDLRSHPVGVFLESVLQNIDASRIACHAYSANKREDVITARLKPLFTKWDEVTALNDHALAEKIHNDGIDILVDLAGHTGENRLPVFAWRSAPIQVAWLGYWASTGVAEIDYFLTDDTSLPIHEAKFYSEKPWYLPNTRLCMSPPTVDHQILVSELPALRNGFITFGTYQILSKISDETLAVWARVLLQIPTAKMRIQSRPLAHPQVVNEFSERLTAAGIDLKRVDLHGGSNRPDYLASYREVDIVLDTFPFPGGTTTAEALWMGVPTITISGDSLLARQGESMLRCVGLNDWVAKTKDEYVELAQSHAGELLKLSRMRSMLREISSKSPLFDAARFAENLQDAFVEMRREKTGKRNEQKMSA